MPIGGTWGYLSQAASQIRWFRAQNLSLFIKKLASSTKSVGKIKINSRYKYHIFNVLANY